MTDRLTQEQQRFSLAAYIPRGTKIWGAVNQVGTVFYSILNAMSLELMRVEKWIALYRQHQIPDVTVLFLDEWESAMGIPDDCFPGTGSDAERLLHVKAKLSALGIQSSADFVTLGALFGFNITVEGGIGSAAYPASFGSDKQARNTIVITFDFPMPPGFPYVFPFVFEEDPVSVIICLFEKLKPATSQIIYLYTP